KLNETEHFLKEGQLERIEALIKQGDQQAAVTEAIRLSMNAEERFAKVSIENRSIFKDSLALIKEGWSDVTAGINAAYQKFLIFRNEIAADDTWSKWAQRMGEVTAKAMGMPLLAPLFGKALVGDRFAGVT